MSSVLFMATMDAYSTSYWASLEAWCRQLASCRMFTCPGSEACGACAVEFTTRWNILCNTFARTGYLDIVQFVPFDVYIEWLNRFNTWWTTVCDPWAVHAIDLGKKGVVDLETYEISVRHRDTSYGRVYEYRDVRPKSAKWIVTDGTVVTNYMPPLSTAHEPAYDANCQQDVKIAISTHATARIDARLQAHHRAERAEAFVQDALRVAYDPDPECDYTLSIMFISDRDAYRRASVAVAKELMLRRKASQLLTPDLETVVGGSGVLTRVKRGEKTAYRAFAVIHRDSTFTRPAVEGVLRVAGAIVTGAYSNRITWHENVPGDDPVKYAVTLLVGQTFNSYNLGAKEVTWWRSIPETEYLEANPPAKVYKTPKGLVGLKRALQNKRPTNPDYYKLERADQHQRIVACYKRVAVLKLNDEENAVFVKLEREIDDLVALQRFIEEVYAANAIPPELQDIAPKLVKKGPRVKSVDGVPVETVPSGLMAH